MAIPSWVSLNKTSGSGDDTVSVSSQASHTGRVSRSGSLTFRASGVTDLLRTVNQAGKSEFVQMQSSASVGKVGGSVTIAGKSNSSKLTFALGAGNLVLILPSQYLANSVPTNNVDSIVGDPGAGAEYDFSITIENIGENEEVENLTKQLTVTTNNAQAATCLITQAAADPFLEVTPEILELDWEGTLQNFIVTSNTTWTII